MPKLDDIPQCPTAPDVEHLLPQKRSYQIQLLTPMFGGGVDTGTPDESFPIRPTAIRGQLQFWWRATMGAQYATKEDLRKAQTDLWGSTDQSSRVTVRVNDVQMETPSRCAEFQWNPNARKGQGGWRINWLEPFNGHDSALPYALFPFQGETPPPKIDAESTNPPSSCIRSGKFQVQIECSRDLWNQLEPAIWAWVNFGGLGARTRRGCGVIFCKDFAPKNAEDMKSQFEKYIPQQYPVRDWPTLAESLAVGTQAKSPVAAWDEVIKLMKDFRQGEKLGRDTGSKPKQPGRSRWPEPESIREATGNRAPFRPRQNHIPADAFPRAEFGLPIVFHFKDNGKGDPPGNDQDKDYTLYPENDAAGNARERMSSPLIIKPLATGVSSAIPVILHMRTLGIRSIDLRQDSTSVSLPHSTIVQDPKLANSSYTNSPLSNSPNGSAIEAFLSYANSQGYETS